MKKVAAGSFVLVTLCLRCTSPDTLSLLDTDSGKTDGGSSTVDAGPRAREAGASRCRDHSDCGKAAPYCDVPSGQCFPCVEDSNCATKLCSTESHTCVRCTKDDDCNAATPLCDRDDGRCIQCRTAAQCATDEVCPLEAHACTSRCRTSADCAGGGRPICAVSAGVCVECGSDADCKGRPPHCNLRIGSCVECQSDDDCPGGRCTPFEPRCVQCLTSADCTAPATCIEFACSG